MRYGHKTSKNILIFSITVNFLLLVGCTSPPKQNTYTPLHSKHNTILKIAKAQLGKPYRYGGINPKTGFDCSGLVNYSYKKAGLSIPRTTRQLYKAAKAVKRKFLKAGDLVFFRINRKKISHVGIYLGNNEFIHAPSSGKHVNIANLNDKYWRIRFMSGGRI